MLNASDVYKYSEKIPVISGQAGSQPTTQIGVIFADYEVREYIDVRNLTSARSYFVTCKQRIVIPNPNGIGTLTNNALESYDAYPIMLISSIAVAAAPTGCQCLLVDYSPKTINTAVTTSAANSTSSGASNTTSSEQTSGRSTSDTNSFEVSASIGFMGDVPTGSVGDSRGTSKTTTTSSSNTTGAANTADAQSMMSGSSTMSIKDWGSYASVVSPLAPSWVWAQEYPWDVTQFHNIDADSNTVVLPNFIQGRLVDQTAGAVYPPSELSLFGVSFLATAKWLIQVPSTYSSADETVSFIHSITCTQASHAVGPQIAEDVGPETEEVYSAVAMLNTLTPFSSTPSTPIDMVKLALDPIVEEGSSNGAVVGFVLSQFIALPPVPADGFRIKSAANNILVTGTGFRSPVNYDAPMTADLSKGPVTLQVFFKIVGALDNLTLFVKHWISDSASLCYMTVSINGLGTIYRHVDAPENGSGSNNITTITLRNQDLSSADFYDYLVMGLNEITITISPSDDPTGQPVPGTYAIRALAIG